MESLIWSKSNGLFVTLQERSIYLRKWYEAIEDNKEELCEIIHLEAGKPKTEAMAEVMYGNAFVEWFSEEARRCYVSKTMWRPLPSYVTV